MARKQKADTTSNVDTDSHNVSGSVESVVEKKSSKSSKVSSVKVTAEALSADTTDKVSDKVSDKVEKKSSSPKKSAGKKSSGVTPQSNDTETVVASHLVSDENVVVSHVQADVVTTPTMVDDFSNFLTHLQQVTTALGALRVEFRALEKKTTRELKVAQKASAKRKRKTGNRSPSGFVKPTLISNELAAFLGRDKGTEMARTDVTREINTYIRAHKLQDPQNGRKINADTLLSELLKLKPDDELTYFNLQKYMSPHFQKQSDKLLIAANVTARAQ